MAPMIVLARVVLLSLVAAGCGARTGIETPLPCDTAEDCPPAAGGFCEQGVACLDGFCAITRAPDCDDRDDCTVDRCDPSRAACEHRVRDQDEDGATDAACGGEDCDDLDPAVHPGATELCRGGVDEDCDATFDCSDLDCATEPACDGCRPEDCRSGADEDCDGALDCDDDDCIAAGECCDPEPETCDGADQDCDGVIDDGVTCYALDGEPIQALATTRCGSDWYAYDSPDTASAAPSPDLRQSDRVAIAIVDSPAACGGAAVAIIADQVRDGSGGSLTGTFTVDRAGVGGVLVSDDPAECTWDAAAQTGACNWRWQECCTDGALIGPLGGDFCLEIALDGASGVSTLVVYDGETVVRDRPLSAPLQLCGTTVPAAP